MDFPRAWQIARETPIVKHDPKCSYAIGVGGLLCDCHVLTQHPEYIKDYGFLKENKNKDYQITINKSSSVRSVLGKIVDILSRMNQGGYMGDIENYINEVQNDLSKMQDQD